MWSVGGGSARGADGATKHLAREQFAEIAATFVDVLTQDRLDNTYEETPVIRQMHRELSTTLSWHDVDSKSPLCMRTTVEFTTLKDDARRLRGIDLHHASNHAQTL